MGVVRSPHLYTLLVLRAVARWHILWLACACVRGRPPHLHALVVLGEEREDEVVGALAHQARVQHALHLRPVPACRKGAREHAWEPCERVRVASAVARSDGGAAVPVGAAAPWCGLVAAVVAAAWRGGSGRVAWRG
eukprot:3171085-Prymnesium_polylepis.1